jgi:hypothetical protein
LSGIPVTKPHDQEEVCFTCLCLVTVPWITVQTATPRFCRSCLKIQLLKDSWYPSHLTKYWTLLPFFLFFKMGSILYKSAFTTWRSNRRTVSCGRPCWAVVWDTCYQIPRSRRSMFYLPLPSNSSMNYCPNNTLTHYYQLWGYCISANPISHVPSWSVIFGNVVV